MDPVEVTLRLDRSLAERLRDPAERARYEGFLGLASDAATQADVNEAAQLLSAAPRVRQRRLKRAFDELRQRAEAAGLIPEEGEHELTARKRERRAARRWSMRCGASPSNRGWFSPATRGCRPLPLSQRLAQPVDPDETTM
jgi:hypothetical protein